MDQGLVILVRRELSGHESNVKEGTRAICLNHMSELMVVDPTNAIVTITLQFDHSTLVQEPDQVTWAIEHPGPSLLLDMNMEINCEIMLVDMNNDIPANLKAINLITIANHHPQWLSRMRT